MLGWMALAGIVAFGGLWMLLKGLDPVIVDQCLDRGGRWDAETRTCVTEDQEARRRYVPIERPRSTACDTLAGEVRAGESWEAPFAGGRLRFRLRAARNAPPNPEGWTIEVGRADDPGERVDDYVWVATPPYRFSNPRYLDTSYGRTAPEAVAWSEREFGYAAGPAEYAALVGLVDTLLYPPEGLEPATRDAVTARWKARMDRAGRGVLRITDSDVVAPGPGLPAGRIERLAFAVTLCPAGAADPVGERPPR